MRSRLFRPQTNHGRTQPLAVGAVGVGLGAYRLPERSRGAIATRFTMSLVCALEDRDNIERRLPLKLGDRFLGVERDVRRQDRGSGDRRAGGRPGGARARTRRDRRRRAVPRRARCERVEVDDRAACTVDQERHPASSGQPVRVEELACGRCQRQVDRHGIARAQELRRVRRLGTGSPDVLPDVERSLTRTRIPSPIARDVTARPMCPKPTTPSSRSGDPMDRHPDLQLPLARPNRRVVQCDPARDGQQQRDRVLGDLIDAVDRDVRDRDPQLRAMSTAMLSTPTP